MKVDHSTSSGFYSAEQSPNPGSQTAKVDAWSARCFRRRDRGVIQLESRVSLSSKRSDQFCARTAINGRVSAKDETAQRPRRRISR